KVKELGVEIRLNEIVGKTVLIEDLLESYDAVFIGSGAGLPQFLKIKGENLCGVYSANEYLTRVNLMKAYKEDAITPIQRGKKVVVVGAGNVAMDAARTALRLGAHVDLVYRRGREEMPARLDEIHHAEEEGVAFNLLTNPVEILGKDGFVSGVKCVRMELGEPDESGRRRPIEVKGSEFIIECDQVIVALGTTPNPIIKQSYPALKTSGKGVFVADEETGATSVDRVYTGGDAMTGAATVIKAMGAGKKAAKAIYQRITG
ncbi:MAG: FAD-dependent oxidoreductase, partial [Clostridiales bacterium]|nr:FAD-dependent oxidoreductase [Clostridiales bacterium]